MVSVVRRVGPALALMLWSAPAFSQATTFQLASDNPPRFEIASHLGWEGVRKDGFERWDDTYDTGTAGLSLGIFLTPHVKAELAVARSGDGFLYTSEPVSTRPGALQYRFLEHTFESLVAAPALTYQFLENQWVHPFVTGGAFVTSERHTIHSPELRTTQTRTTLSALPFVGVGAKFYASTRVFVRTDFRVTPAAADTIRTGWTAGVGFEF